MDVVPDAGAVGRGVVTTKHTQELPLAQGHLVARSRRSTTLPLWK